MRLHTCCLALASSLVALLPAAPSPAAPPQGATEAIRQANDRLRSQLELELKDPGQRDQIRARISQELRVLLDIPFLAQRSLVDHWATMTPAQRSEIQNTLQAIIEKNYLNQLRGNLNYRTDYVGEENEGQDVLVKTLIHTERNGRPSKLSVNYRLRQEGDHWRIYDVITEDVSILQNYRSQFNRIIAKDGVDGLIARMKAKLEKGDEKDNKAEK